MAIVTGPTQHNEKAGDAYARCRTGNTAGRGSVAGWTPCPLCSNSFSFLPLPSFAPNNTISKPTHKSLLAEKGLTPSPSIFSTTKELLQVVHLYLSFQDTSNKQTTKSVKLFSHGRGLAAHLHAVHTPWNPGKAEIKRRKSFYRRQSNEKRRKEFRSKCFSSKLGADEGCTKRVKLLHQDSASNNHLEKPGNNSEFGVLDENEVNFRWDPTGEEVKEWNQAVMEIVAIIEKETKKAEKRASSDNSMIYSENLNNTNGGNFTGEFPNEKLKGNLTKKRKLPANSNVIKGLDRHGNPCPSYRKSLSPFLAAAADGNLSALQMCLDIENEVRVAKDSYHHTDSEGEGIDLKRRKHIHRLLSERDRNGSTAEHWAAGGGHIGCLTYLLELRDRFSAYELKGEKKCSSKEDIDLGFENGTASASNSTSSIKDSQTAYKNKKIRRRRDGKTSLHYAARNGHNNCIDLLLVRPDAPAIDIPSGDGTTPLQLACYGGHLSTVEHLVEKYLANPHAVNEWGCGSAHWVAMSLGNNGSKAVIDICNYLKKKCNVDFAIRQRQGHTPLHKAASRKNRHVIEWLAGRCMDGSSLANGPFDKKDDINMSIFSKEEKKSMGLPDEGGNLPSDIWLNVGGDEEFGMWMKSVCGW